MTKNYHFQIMASLDDLNTFMTCRQDPKSPCPSIFFPARQPPTPWPKSTRPSISWRGSHRRREIRRGFGCCCCPLPPSLTPRACLSLGQWQCLHQPSHNARAEVPRNMVLPCNKRLTTARAE